jgi:hypothetical protein
VPRISEFSEFFSPPAIDCAGARHHHRRLVQSEARPQEVQSRTMPDRLAKVGDLFEAVFRNRAKLPALK